MKTGLSGLFDRSFWRAALPLALPIALQNLLMTSFRLVDTLMVGRLGDVSLAAVGLAGYVSFLVELISFGMASGGAVFMAQYHGAGNRAGILRSFGAMLMVMAPLGLLFTLLVGLFPARVMGLFTNDARLIAEGARYLRFASLSYAPLSLSLMVAAVLRCTERVHIPLVTSGVCAALNALLGYALIFGAFGLPAMGVLGAGLALAVSSMLNLLLLLLLAKLKRTIVFSPLRQIFALRGFLKTFWPRAMPALLNEMLWGLSVVCINMVFGRLGVDNFAALTMQRTIGDIVFVFFIGICNACNILVGKSIGAGRVEEGKAYARRFLYFVPLLGAALGLVVFSLRGPLVSMFDLSHAASATARTLLLIYAVDVSIRNIPYVATAGIFRAGGETRFGMFVDIAVQYGIVLPIAALCGLVWKLPFALTYLCVFAAEDVTKLVLILPFYRSMRWIKPIRQDDFAAAVSEGT